MIGVYLIIFALVMFCLLSYLSSDNTTEGFQSEPTLPPFSQGYNYQQRLNEIVDTDRVLDRTVVPGKQKISTLKVPLSDPHITDKYHRVGKVKQRTLNFKDKKKVCIPPNHPVYQLINDQQPYMFDRPELVDYYGRQYYWDWRYPRKRIDIKFLTDPKGYCKKNPNTYPCYIIKSRMQLK